MRLKLIGILALLVIASGAHAQVQGRLPGILFPSDRGPRTGVTLQSQLTAVSTVPYTFVLDRGTWSVTNDISFPVTVALKLLPGAVFSIANGANLEILGEFDAPKGVVFTGLGTASGPATFPYRHVEWGDAGQFDIGTGYLSSVDAWEATVAGVAANLAVVSNDFAIVSGVVNANSGILSTNAMAHNYNFTTVLPELFDDVFAGVSGWNKTTFTNSIWKAITNTAYIAPGSLGNYLSLTNWYYTSFGTIIKPWVTNDNQVFGGVNIDTLNDNFGILSNNFDNLNEDVGTINTNFTSVSNDFRVVTGVVNTNASLVVTNAVAHNYNFLTVLPELFDDMFSGVSGWNRTTFTNSISQASTNAAFITPGSLGSYLSLTNWYYTSFGSIIKPWVTNENLVFGGVNIDTLNDNFGVLSNNFTQLNEDVGTINTNFTSVSNDFRLVAGAVNTNAAIVTTNAVAHNYNFLTVLPELFDDVFSGVSGWNKTTFTNSLYLAVTNVAYLTPGSLGSYLSLTNWYQTSFSTIIQPWVTNDNQVFGGIDIGDLNQNFMNLNEDVGTINTNFSAVSNDFRIVQGVVNTNASLVITNAVAHNYNFTNALVNLLDNLFEGVPQWNRTNFIDSLQLASTNAAFIAPGVLGDYGSLTNWYKVTFTNTIPGYVPTANTYFEISGTNMYTSGSRGARGQITYNPATDSLNDPGDNFSTNTSVYTVPYDGQYTLTAWCYSVEAMVDIGFNRVADDVDFIRGTGSIIYPRPADLGDYQSSWSVTRGFSAGDELRFGYIPRDINLSGSAYLSNYTLSIQLNYRTDL